MSWATRIRMSVGIVLVLALCAALTLVLNRRVSQVTSATATIQAEEVAVGTDYAGTVTDQTITEGDRVTEGDPLFTVRSLVLAHDLSVGVVSPGSGAYSVSDDGALTAAAPVNGVVTDVAVSPGGFAQAGEVVATIQKAGSLYVDARMLLEPADFARIHTGSEATIVLPDQTEVTGVVKDLEVQNTDNHAEATIRVVSDALSGSGHLAQPGTPVTVSVELADEGLLSGVDLTFRQFLREVGL